MRHGTSPWQVAIVALILLLAIPSGYSTMNFLLAETPEQATARGRSMPAEWEAGVWNHGKYLKWYRISEHPWMFGGGCVGLLAAVGTLLMAAAGSQTPEAKRELELLQQQVERLKSP
jgi:hypothetical protein